MGKLKTAVALILSLTALAGCGSESESESDKAKGVATDFAKAAGSGDGEKACSYIVDKTRKELDSTARELRDLGASGYEAKTCAEFTTSIMPRFPEVSKVDVSGNRGQAEVTGSGDQTVVLQLVKQGEDWRVDEIERPQ